MSSSVGSHHHRAEILRVKHQLLDSEQGTRSHPEHVAVIEQLLIPGETLRRIIPTKPDSTRLSAAKDGTASAGDCSRGRDTLSDAVGLVQYDAVVLTQRTRVDGVVADLTASSRSLLDIQPLTRIRVSQIILQPMIEKLLYQAYAGPQCSAVCAIPR